MLSLRSSLPLLALLLVLGSCSSDSSAPAPGGVTTSPAAPPSPTALPSLTSTPISTDLGPTPVRADTPPGRIVFLSFRDGNREIYITNTDGTGLRNLTNDPGVDENPDVSPDGASIVWASDRDGGQLHLYTMNIDGTDVRKLTDAAGGMSPRWSREGSRIAYARAGSIYVIDSEGGEPRLVMEADESEPCRAGAFPGGWSPDETEIVYYTVVPGGDAQICLTDLEGNISVLIAEPGVTNAEPTWSPDGRYIAYRSIRVDGNHEVFIYDTETATSRNLTNHSALDIEPNWSPDGQWIVFSSSRNNDFSDIHLVSVVGSRVVQVTTDRDKDSEPVWVP